MDNTPTRKEIIQLLSDYINGEFVEENNKYRVSFGGEKTYTFVVSFKELDELSNKLSRLDINEETALYSDNTYEVIVREESVNLIRRLRKEKIEIRDNENGLRYELSPASDEYLLWLLGKIRGNLSSKRFRTNIFYPFMFEKYLDESEKPSLIEAIKLGSSNRFLTLKISSIKKQSPSQFSKLTYAFLFHISYNLDVALVPQRLLEEISRRSRITKIRRSKIEDIDPPKRIYNEDLVQHYLLAVSTDNPVIEYLSYYHVLEHFYEAVFNDDLVESIKNKITDPGFSYKRKKDIGQIITKIKKSLQISSEIITFSESEALGLCLRKYIDISELKTKLAEYDETLIEYYKTTKVQFSGGNEVDICNQNEDSVVKALSQRIYSTRNALVHSKDGDKSKYTPFKDDRVLVKEVPMLRFISEMVIFKDSLVH